MKHRVFQVFDIQTSGSAADCYMIKTGGQFAAPSITLVEQGLFPPTTVGAGAWPINDLRYLLWSSFVNALDNYQGMLPCFFQQYTRVRVNAVKVTAEWMPTESSPNINQVAFFILSVPEEQANQQTLSALFYEYFKMMPKKHIAIKDMKSIRQANFASVFPVKVSKFISCKSINKTFKKDPRSYDETITGQQGPIASLGVNGPSNVVGSLCIGMCSKDGANFTINTAYFRVKLAFTLYLSFYAPIVYPNYGN